MMHFSVKTTKERDTKAQKDKQTEQITVCLLKTKKKICIDSNEGKYREADRHRFEHRHIYTLLSNVSPVI